MVALGTNKQISEQIFYDFIHSQIEYEKAISPLKRKKQGIFFTNKILIIDRVLDCIKFDQSIFNSTILEPSCGHGIFILRFLFKLYQISPNPKILKEFISNNLFLVDVNHKMTEKVRDNINKLWCLLFNCKYSGEINTFNFDFTNKNNCIKDILGNVDYIIGNPPYVSLYGRRDKKENELQRINYLNSYNQFPKSVKNGKINYIMLFLERSLDYLKYDGKLAFIIDIAFFETAYLYTRKYLLENTQIQSIIHNINEFNVASGQIILSLKKTLPLQNKNQVNVLDCKSNEIKYYDQNEWYLDSDQYRFRIFGDYSSQTIINYILELNLPSLYELYPNKNLRTCTMLLDMEDKFVFSEPPTINNNLQIYPYYKGSKSLKEKFGELKKLGFFNYDKNLQDMINNQLKIELELKGIKNKKRIGLGESLIYDCSKIYIRQSAKQIIATFDNKPSAANNSLYIFTLRDYSDKSINFLYFLCGYLNSDLITFFCQQKEIIRYRQGKQPQIKISDLYSIPIPNCELLQQNISLLVKQFYSNNLNDRNHDFLLNKINNLVYSFYNINSQQIQIINKSINSF